MVLRAFRLAAAIAALVIVPGAASAQHFSESYEFLDAVRKGDGNKVTQFLNKPGQTIVNTRDPETGEGALAIVARRGDSTYLRFLLQRDADPNSQAKNGETPLLIAVQQGFIDGVTILLDYHANINLANSRGETPLIRAVQLRKLDMVRLLLSKGADPDQSDVIAGLSARDYAKQDTRSPAIAKLLADAPKVARRAAAGPVIN